MLRRKPRLHHLNWNLLNTFLVIVEEGSITRAADRLMVRQPSVTAALQRLEDTLGGQLIVRDSRRFLLTKRGEMLHRECITIHRAVARIGESLGEVADEMTGHVRVQVITHLVLPAFDRLLNTFHAAHPAVTLRIDVASSQDIVRSVSQKQSPFGFCLLAKPLIGLDCRLVLRETFGILCGRSHPLYGRANVPLADLHDEGFVALSCGQEGALEPMIMLRDGAGFTNRTVGSSPHLEEVARMIGAGIGIGILPVASVAAALAAGDLWDLSSLDDQLGADVYFIANPAMEKSPAEAAFAALVAAELERNESHA